MALFADPDAEQRRRDRALALTMALAGQAQQLPGQLLEADRHRLNAEQQAFQQRLDTERSGREAAKQKNDDATTGAYVKSIDQQIASGKLSDEDQRRKRALVMADDLARRSAGRAKAGTESAMRATDAADGLEGPPTAAAEGARAARASALKALEEPGAVAEAAEELVAVSGGTISRAEAEGAIVSALAAARRQTDADRTAAESHATEQRKGAAAAESVETDTRRTKVQAGIDEDGMARVERQLGTELTAAQIESLLANASAAEVNAMARLLAAQKKGKGGAGKTKSQLDAEKAARGAAGAEFDRAIMASRYGSPDTSGRSPGTPQATIQGAQEFVDTYGALLPQVGVDIPDGAKPEDLVKIVNGMNNAQKARLRKMVTDNAVDPANVPRAAAPAPAEQPPAGGPPPAEQRSDSPQAAKERFARDPANLAAIRALPEASREIMVRALNDPSATVDDVDEILRFIAPRPATELERAGAAIAQRNAADAKRLAPARPPDEQSALEAEQEAMGPQHASRHAAGMAEAGVGDAVSDSLAKRISGLSGHASRYATAMAELAEVDAGYAVSDSLAKRISGLAGAQGQPGPTGPVAQPMAAREPPTPKQGPLTPFAAKEIYPLVGMTMMVRDMEQAEQLVPGIRDLPPARRRRIANMIKQGASQRLIEMEYADAVSGR